MDQRVTEALFKNDIENVFNIVSKATSAKRPTPKKNETEKKIETGAKRISLNSIPVVLTFLMLIGVMYAMPSDPLKNTTLVFLLLILLMMITMFVLIIMSGSLFIWSMRLDPFAPFLGLVKSSYEFDLQYINQLAHCDINAKRYVLTYYKFEREGFEKRGSLLSGSIEKIGLFPALAALAVLSASLFKITSLGRLPDILVLSILAFYILNFATFFMSQKKDQVIAMLEFSIQSHPEQQLAT